MVLGYPKKSFDNIICDERLLERNMGEIEGITRKRAKRIYPNLFIEERFNVFKTPPQGECYNDYKKRIQDFYINTLKEEEGLKILICSHNQTLKMLRLFILEKEITHESWSEFSFKNGELTEIGKVKMV